MIVDTLTHWKDYSWPSDRFRKGFEFLAQLKPDAPEGRVDIDGDDVYSMVQVYETRKLEGHQFEAHRQYADIQCLLSGRERILWAPHEELEVIKPYEPDAEFQKIIPDATEIVLQPGLFCVFFPPRDAHAPCVRLEGPAKVKKVVIKVRV